MFCHFAVGETEGKGGNSRGRTEAEEAAWETAGAEKRSECRLAFTGGDTVKWQD